MEGPCELGGMDRRAPATATAIGLLACVGLFATLAWPYLALPESARVAIGRYYWTGLFGVPVLAAFAAPAVVILLAGWRGRSDPATVAGATIAIGVAMTVMAVEWALAVRGASVEIWLAFHPWLVVAFVALLPISGLVAARRQGLL